MTSLQCVSGECICRFPFNPHLENIESGAYNMITGMSSCYGSDRQSRIKCMQHRQVCMYCTTVGMLLPTRLQRSTFVIRCCFLLLEAASRTNTVKVACPFSLLLHH